MPTQKESQQRKKAPSSPSMANNAIDTLHASQVRAREKLAFGSNSFQLNPLLTAVLGDAEGNLLPTCSFGIKTLYEIKLMRSEITSGRVFNHAKTYTSIALLLGSQAQSSIWYDD
ncbi:hypothetical protein [Zhongshania aliphaticivorans]|uniref:hypothetical protein n=1 Tax=Zhongshania aliphaticivorans TaxID=1470434 RepID=UPI00132F6100|nr:hypothetical protein [Zhongshania aliphaticivorans]